MKKISESFAGRLSLKIILITSMIFMLAIGLISIYGSRYAERSSLDYSAQVLQSSLNKLENSIRSVETVAKNITGAVEAVNNLGAAFDSTYYYEYLASTVKDSPYVLGAGVFYLPYKYDRENKHLGIYVNRDISTGEISNEWDDEAMLAEDGWDYFDAEWYQIALAAGTDVWVPPFREYTFYTDYQYMSAFVTPVRNRKGEVIAVCDVDMSLSWLKKELLSMRPYPESNVVLVDPYGNYICNPLADNPNEGNMIDNPVLPDREFINQGIDDGNWDKREDGISFTRFKSAGTPMFCVRGELFNGWQLLIINKYEDAFANLIRICLMVAIVALLGLVFLFFMSRRIIHRETRPLSTFAEAAAKITGGHFDIPIPELKRKDEINKLGSALRFMQTSVTNYIDELQRTTSEKERLAGELDIAKKIQMQMLNRNFTAPEGSGLFASSIPARQVGGDLFDFHVDGDNLYYIVADVSGKGVPAALLMSISISAFRATISNGHSMAEIAGIINNVFCHSNEDNMFITVNVGRINTATGEYEVCNAGHNPVVLTGPDGEASFLHLKNNLVCGVMPDFPYQNDNLKLRKGSRLLIYTDGVTEAEDSTHAQYGETRLLDFARAHNKSIVPDDETVIGDLIASVNSFVDGAEQFDDITMMSITI